MHNTLLLATRNRHKQRELEELLSPLGIKVISLADIPDCPEIEEDGQSFEENAIKKARLTALHTGLTTLADDSGLEVEALGGLAGSPGSIQLALPVNRAMTRPTTGNC